jgi:hypothetical protein
MGNFIGDFFENRGWLRIPQHNSTTGGLEVSGTPISNSFALATMPDAASVEAGSVISIPKTEFTNAGGMLGTGIKLESDGSVWLPYNGAQLFSQGFGSKASPLVSIAATGVETNASITLPNGNPVVPKELLRLGFKVRFQALVGKTSVSGGASTYSCHFGWSATYTDNANIGYYTLTTGTDKTILIDTLGCVTAYASAASNTISGHRLIPGSVTGIATDGYVDRNNTQDFTKDAYCSFSLDPGAGGGTNTDALYWYRIWLEA